MIAKEADPQRERTIGVITKPDTLAPKEEGPWIDIVEGREHHLALGYFMTKQPTQEQVERKISHHEARQSERDFFEGHPIWSKCSDEARARMGTKALGASLSRFLTDYIDQKIPGLREQVRELKHRLTTSLNRLPQKSKQSPSLQLLDLITRFSTELGLLAIGDSKHLQMIQLCRPAYRTFRKQVRGTAPRFLGRAKQEPSDRVDWTEYINARGGKLPPSSVEQEEEHEVYAPRSSVAFAPSVYYPTPSPMVPATPSINRATVQPDTDYSEDSDDIAETLSLRDQQSRQSSPRKKIYLDDINKIVNQHITRELPFNVPYGAKVALMLGCFESWDSMAKSCANSIITACTKETLALSKLVYGRLPYPALARAVTDVIEATISQLTEELVQRLQWLVEMDSMPFTQSLSNLRSYKIRFLAKYKKERPIKYKGQVDIFEEELNVAAEVRAYFHIAYKVIHPMTIPRSIDMPLVLIICVNHKRIIDNVPRVVDSDFIRLLRPRMEKALHAKFFSDSATPARYMTEDPSVVAERAGMEARLERLDDIESKLEAHESQR